MSEEFNSQIAVIWKRHDEQAKVISELVANYQLFAHRIGTLEQGQMAQTQRMVELRMELLSAINHGDANIVNALKEYQGAVQPTLKDYQNTVQSLMSSHHQQLGARDANRWLVGTVIALLSLALAFNLIKGGP